MTTRVAVVGAGGVGCCFAAQASGAGHDVVACVRRPFERYEIESDVAPFSGPAIVATDPSHLDGTWSWVLVGVKAHQTDGAAGWLDRVCSPDTVVVALQNGIEAVARLTPFVNGAEIIPAVVYCGAELVAPGRVQHRQTMRLIVPDTTAGRRLGEVFAGTEAQIDPDPDHHTKAWVKLSINAVANGLTALTDRPMGMLDEPAILPVATRLLAECWEVAVADGAAIDRSDPERQIRAMAALGDASTSMHQDVRAGRATEHDAIHGAVLRAGARHGIDVPTVAAVHAILATRTGDG